jgi:hypothetical protein
MQEMIAGWVGFRLDRVKGNIDKIDAIGKDLDKSLSANRSTLQPFE